jgi:hypothetical protein
MIFFKHFDTSKQTLLGAGKAVVAKNSKVSDLVPIINERMRWAPGTPLKLYEVSLLVFCQGVLADEIRDRKSNPE